jgi:hypothetical protein
MSVFFWWMLSGTILCFSKEDAPSMRLENRIWRPPDIRNYDLIIQRLNQNGLL